MLPGFPHRKQSEMWFVVPEIDDLNNLFRVQFFSIQRSYSQWELYLTVKLVFQTCPPSLHSLLARQLVSLMTSGSSERKEGEVLATDRQKRQAMFIWTMDIKLSLSQEETDT
ncbi:hypothetical protein FQN60_001684 [Etheostoma spectabile]|uniref:Uncharacterized protein n=1 Tax=Etheostoma spectabile TaxID=54343 RepID=A0A5J5DDQ1_9PERO|nr:hypothetical protein FQN60_001684 [Etheostoma spectabile]